MTVSDLLEQPCNKSDNQLLPNLLTTWDKQCEHNLLTACLQACYKMWDFYACMNTTYIESPCLEYSKIYRMAAVVTIWTTLKRQNNLTFLANILCQEGPFIRSTEAIVHVLKLLTTRTKFSDIWLIILCIPSYSPDLAYCPWMLRVMAQGSLTLAVTAHQIVTRSVMTIWAAAVAEYFM
jgi:hypothetical protein